MPGSRGVEQDYSLGELDFSLFLLLDLGENFVSWEPSFRTRLCTFATRSEASEVGCAPSWSGFGGLEGGSVRWSGWHGRQAVERDDWLQVTCLDAPPPHSDLKFQAPR